MLVAARTASINLRVVPRHARRRTRATWRLRITSDELMRRLGLDAADFYVARRQLGWLGHVARMGYRDACSPAGCRIRGHAARRV